MYGGAGFVIHGCVGFIIPGGGACFVGREGGAAGREVGQERDAVECEVEGGDGHPKMGRGQVGEAGESGGRGSGFEGIDHILTGGEGRE
jgi:hypothetical protein